MPVKAVSTRKEALREFKVRFLKVLLKEESLTKVTHLGAFQKYSSNFIAGWDWRLHYIWSTRKKVYYQGKAVWWEH